MSGALTARKRRQRNGAVAASILAHAVIFVIIGLNVPKPVYREPPSLPTANIWLIPRLTPQSHESSARAARAAATTPLPSASNTATPKPAASSPVMVAPNTPTPSAPPGVASGLPAQAEPGVGASYGTGVRGALRTSIGCDLGHLAHLTQEEKDRCNQHVGETARLGPKFIDPIPAEKRAYYDAVQAAYQAAKNPINPLIRDANGNIQPWGHGPGVGCGMKFGGPPQPPDHRSLTDKIKATGLLGVDLGPLRCGIVIPQGSMTPEVGIPVP